MFNVLLLYVSDSSTTYEVSFILSNTTWNEMYSDSSDAATVALRDDILAAVSYFISNPWYLLLALN